MILPRIGPGLEKPPCGFRHQLAAKSKVERRRKPQKGRAGKKKGALIQKSKP